MGRRKTRQMKSEGIARSKANEPGNIIKVHHVDQLGINNIYMF